MKLHHALLAAALAAVSAAHAQQPAGTADHPAHHASDPAATPLLSQGEVRKVDLAHGKVTLRHGPLPNLDMPGMTMTFTAADRKLLKGVKQGDKVKFTAGRQGDTYTVVALEVVR